MTHKKRNSKPRNTLLSLVFSALLISAIVEQLRRPKQERTWHGNVLGIPYDFRRPTLAKICQTFWNDQTTQLLVPQAFGMGWSINVYPLLHLMSPPAKALPPA
jgi:hypothetical protein